VARSEAPGTKRPLLGLAPLTLDQFLAEWRHEVIIANQQHSNLQRRRHLDPACENGNFFGELVARSIPVRARDRFAVVF
jgi:hypothetical protein